MLECVVKRQPTPETKRYKIAMVVLTVMLGILTIYAQLLLPALIASIIMTAHFFKKVRSIEYEYAFENGNLSVDRIISGKKRKHQMSFQIGQAETICPYRDFKWDGRTKPKVYDFASARPDARVYVAHLRQFGQDQAIILEPDDAMLQAIKEAAPEVVRLTSFT